MQKRLYLVLAVLLTPVFLFACSGHEEAGKSVDPKVVEATVARATSMADSLDAMTSKAYRLGQVGSAMAALNPSAASAVLDEAYDAAMEVQSPIYSSALKELKATTADWPSSEMDQVAGPLGRINEATTRVWAVRSIAEGMAKLDKTKAMAVLVRAADKARQNPDSRYADMDLRSIAALMAGMDPEAAYGVASQIKDPRIKVWALNAAGNRIAQARPDEAARILSAAAEVAQTVAGMEAASELVTEETPAEEKAKVLEAESARLQATSARMLAGIAADIFPLDGNAARDIARKAVETAQGINAPYTRAYALSNVAIALADINPSIASDIADGIALEHADARFAAFNMAAMKSAGAGTMDELKKAEAAAGLIEDEYTRAKAHEALAIASIGASPEKAAELAEHIEYPLLRDEVLAAVAVSYAGEGNIGAATEALDKIEEPRFANKNVFYTKAKAYTAIAASLTGRDDKTAMKMYGKAIGAANEAGSTRLLWWIAAEMCKTDQDKLFEMAATIEPGDYHNQAMALSEIAADWSAKNNYKAPMVWDMAAKAANAIEDNAESSELLNKVALRCAQYDPSKAAEIFAKSLARAKGIGMAVEG